MQWRLPASCLSCFTAAVVLARCAIAASTPAPRPAPASRPTTSPATAAAAIDPTGKWVIARIDTKAGPGFAKNFQHMRIDLRADKTCRHFNLGVGGADGTWKLEGQNLTITNGWTESELQRGVSTTLKVEGDHLVSRSDILTLIYDRVPEAEAKGQAKFKLTPDGLMAEFEKDAAAAERKYDGQLVEISGVLKATPSDNSPYIILFSRRAGGGEPGESSRGVLCLTIHKDPASLVNKGDAATLRGYLLFHFSGGEPRLLESELVPTAKPGAKGKK
jgi:hypothetical protein